MTKMAKGRNENHKLNNIKLSRENTKCGEAALFIVRPAWAQSNG